MECLSLKDGNQDSLFPNGVCSNWYAFISLHSFWNQSGRRAADYILKRRNPGWVTTKQHDLERSSNNRTEPTETTKTTKTTSNKGGLDSTPFVCSCGHHNFCLFRKNPEKCFLFQLLECPSIYELLANPNFKWKDTPLLQIWRENLDNDGKKSALLESYEPEEAIKMIEKALSSNEVCYSHFKLLGNSAYPNAHSFWQLNCNGRSLLMACIFRCPLIWIYWIGQRKLMIF
jgi:hypothetical protein